MMRSTPTRRDVAQGACTRLWMMVLLCVSLMLCASTAQACHAHDALLLAKGKAQLVAPVDECPLCAAPHAAMAASTQCTVAQMPQEQGVTQRAEASRQGGVWSFDLFSRPPPVEGLPRRVAGDVAEGSLL